MTSPGEPAKDHLMVPEDGQTTPRGLTGGLGARSPTAPRGYALFPGRARDQRDLAVEPSRHNDHAFLAPESAARRCPIGFCAAGAGPTDVATAATV